MADLVVFLSSGAKAGSELAFLRSSVAAPCQDHEASPGRSFSAVWLYLLPSRALARMNTFAHILPEIERAAVDAAVAELFG